MSVSLLFAIIMALALVGYLLGRANASALKSSGNTLHSIPPYHGYYVALWCGLPAFVLVLIWQAAQSSVIDQLLIASLPAHLTEGVSAARISLVLGEIKNVAAGRLFGTPEPAVLAAAERYASMQSTASLALVVCTLAVAVAGIAFARARLAPDFRARNNVDNILRWLLIICSVLAVLTTLGIILSLVIESLAFFSRVPVLEFLFGMNWSPQTPIRADQVASTGAFGAVPVFWGTIFISAIAMFVALPVGLFSAIYLVEYADKRIRSIVKPLLEILAGIPTIVYGFFAVLTVAPFIREFGLSLGLDVASNSALAAGGVMGIMIIPFISSFSDDAISAVPQSMRDGAYALGATKAETIRQVLLPAALPGIVGGVLLAVSRAIGETMIVVMAAGLTATLTANPLEGVTTVTVQIVTLLIGDTEFDSPKTLAAFGLGLVLFISTLALNIVALQVVKRYRERYE
ncbi:phosphate ABC transporter permease subunit PstC [Parvibaculum sp.]|jgi:phosphate transport system permease protein|uniref:phosphate ABC transporter permease subunit PstC n=1 Tax=Parvibaculum sp. TaxID=2024848 RepID=UPI001B274771|nr:phosphate ABC transporter permease subunit PstC [Parvibaculum sp.]MBO6635867.1 phosphate ABC transporter permease subunit PstC [Parvibaculum sp.]MBO6678055.1 phosphate ABC transporter permease subunit PstC [Parvibaculum sp.]MBO6684377.1 phosphate ABC transporter permease subunit PstC [Parvibaculum sp.]MBO6904025.1 phosphate ABC transporter permease subunit PstC [Parvibaculum sp.]